MPRSRDVTTQRAQLSAATWAVVAERGVTGLTLRAVAERAGCTTGLVLHAFPDKRALLRHARQLLFDRAAERSDRLEAEAASPAEALRAVLRASLDGDDESRVWLAFLAAALADDELMTSHVDGNRSFLDRVTRLLTAATRERATAHERATTRERATAHDRTADPGRVATGLVALVEGLNSLAAADPERYSPAVRTALVDEAVDRALAPR